MPSKRKGVVEPSNVEEENVNVPEPVQSNVEPISLMLVMKGNWKRYIPALLMPKKM